MEIAPPKRSVACVSVYLILKKADSVLLSLRKNTGYCDGMWCLIAGHVEEGESAMEAMLREAKEEIGISLSLSQIRPVHAMHRKGNRLNVDLFFECLDYSGNITNAEPDKCERLEFFPLASLPTNLFDYNAAVLKDIEQGKCYSEWGWNSPM